MKIIDLDTHRRSINAMREALLEFERAKARSDKVTTLRPELPVEWSDILEIALIAPALLDSLESCKDGLKRYVIPDDDDLTEGDVSESEAELYEGVRRDVAFAEHLLSTARNRKKDPARGG